MKRILFMLSLMTGPALAVMESAPAPLDAGQASSEGDQQAIRLDIPVTWQVTRARIEASGVTAETESYRETWTLLYNPGAYSMLRSPRGEAPIFPGPRRLAGGVPATILLAEADFAKLVGLDRHISDRQSAGEEAVAKGRMVNLSLQQVEHGATLTLHLSPEEHFAVHLSVGDFSKL